MGSEDVRPGVLAAVRDLTLNVDRLDDLRGELTIDAQRLWGDQTRLLYEFRIQAAGGEVLRGRAAVVLTQASA